MLKITEACSNANSKMSKLRERVIVEDFELIRNMG